MTKIARLPYKYLVAIVYIVGLFSREFNASTSAVEWTVTGYLLSLRCSRRMLYPDST